MSCACNVLQVDNQIKEYQVSEVAMACAGFLEILKNWKNWASLEFFFCYLRWDSSSLWTDSRYEFAAVTLIWLAWRSQFSCVVMPSLLDFLRTSMKNIVQLVYSHGEFTMHDFHENYESFSSSPVIAILPWLEGSGWAAALFTLIWHVQQRQADDASLGKLKANATMQPWFGGPCIVHSSLALEHVSRSFYVLF